MKIQTNNTIVKGALILALTTILYFQDFLFLFNEAVNSEVFSHILAIPFMFFYLLYRLKKIIYASTEWKSSSLHYLGPFLIKDIIGVILCTLAYSIKWYGSYTFLPVEFHIASLPIFISGIILIMFNFTTLRTLLFPIAFLIFLLPPPLNIIQIVGTALSIFSSQASYAITKFTGIPVELLISYNNPIIYLTTSVGQEISLIIDVACSGLYSLIGFSLFAVFLAYITRGSLKLKGLMLLIGFPIIYFLNIIRIIALIYIGYFFGPELALKTFHLLGGWILIFIGTLFLLIISEKFLNVKLRISNTVLCEFCPNETLNSICSTCGKINNKLELKFNRSEIGKILIISVIILLLTIIQVPVFAFTNKGAEISLFGSETYSSKNIFPDIDNYDFKFVYRDRAFENISGQDASLMYMYEPQNKENRIIWVGLEIGPTRACLHRWEGCLIDWPTVHGRDIRVTKLDLRDVRLTENPPLTARYFAFYWNETQMGQVVLYWYTTSIFETPDGYQEKIVKISVIGYPIESAEYDQVEQELYPFAEAIVSHWTPISNWSEVAVLIAKNSVSSIALLILSLVTVIVIYYVEKRGKTLKINAVLNRFTEHDMAIYTAIKSLADEPKTTAKISAKILENSGIIVTDEYILNYVDEAEKVGLISRKLININDEPFSSWAV